MFVVDSAATFPPWAWIALAAGLLCAWAASLRYSKGLHKYNGPFIASFTNFWRMWQWVWYTDMCYFPSVVKYGKIIRIGPNTLLFNDPEAIKDIYMTHFNKVCERIDGAQYGRMRGPPLHACQSTLLTQPSFSPTSTRSAKGSRAAWRSPTSFPPLTESIMANYGGRSPTPSP